MTEAKRALAVRQHLDALLAQDFPLKDVVQQTAEFHLHLTRPHSRLVDEEAQCTHFVDTALELYRHTDMHTVLHRFREVLQHAFDGTGAHERQSLDDMALHVLFNANTFPDSVPPGAYLLWNLPLLIQPSIVERAYETMTHIARLAKHREIVDVFVDKLVEYWHPWGGNDPEEALEGDPNPSLQWTELVRWYCQQGPHVPHVFYVVDRVVLRLTDQQGRRVMDHAHEQDKLVCTLVRRCIERRSDAIRAQAYIGSKLHASRIMQFASHILPILRASDVWVERSMQRLKEGRPIHNGPVVPEPANPEALAALTDLLERVVTWRYAVLHPPPDSVIHPNRIRSIPMRFPDDIRSHILGYSIDGFRDTPEDRRRAAQEIRQPASQAHALEDSASTSGKRLKQA